MPRPRPISRRKPLALAVVLAFAALIVVAATAAAAAGSNENVNDLNAQLGHQQARASALSASIATLNGEISSLDRQIELVQTRVDAVRAALQTDETRLQATHGQLSDERRLESRLHAVLARAELILGRQLRSSYENGHPSLISVVIEAHGFAQLLDQLNFLDSAEEQQQSLITATQTARAHARAAATRLTRLQSTERVITAAAQTEARAVDGMDVLLQSRQNALASTRAAQKQALASTRASGAKLRAAIARAQAAAAAAAASEAAQVGSGAGNGSSVATNGSSTASTGAGNTGALGPSAGWAIPYAIVLCESGGQNLPPNSAGASGYYQIIPSTWKAFGGPGPAAYLAQKSIQDEVAARIWNGGAGASDWVCAGIVGIR